MAFASVFVPNFPLQAVVRTEPALRERAVALIEGNPPLSSVIAPNEKAAQIGITIGMTKTDAEQFSGVEIRSRSLPQEAIAHAALLDIGWSISPRLEDFSLDTIILDLSGLESLLGSENEIASHLIERSSACGLRVNVTIAANIDTALIAARGFAGVTVIPSREESRSLGSLPVRVLSPTEETLETLRRWGITTCADLAALPVLDLSERLGQEGVRLHALARGAISRSIVIAELAHSFEEEMELDDAVEELDPLSFVLGRLLDQLCARLNGRALGAAAIRICFELQPSFDAPASRDEIRTEKKQPSLYEKEIQLPIPARDSKMLLKLLRLRLQLNPPGAPIQKITLAADAARPRASQNGLFLPSFPDPEKLELTITRIAHVVGEGNVGSPSLTDTHRPGDFEMRRFLVPQESSKANRRRKSARSAKKPGEDAKILMTLRIFRPAIPAKLDLESGCPTRVTFQGLRGEVVAASGPWLTSGDWWRENSRSSPIADATNKSFESDSRGAAIVISPARSATAVTRAQAGILRRQTSTEVDAECREPKDKSPSPGGTIGGRNHTPRFLGGRSFSSDITPRPLNGTLAPEASPWHHDEWDLEIHFDCDLHDRNVRASRSPGGMLEDRDRSSRFLGSRSFSSDIMARPLNGALAPEDREPEIHYDAGLKPPRKYFKSDRCDSRGAAIVISPARSAAKCREQKDESPSPVGTIDSNGSNELNPNHCHSEERAARFPSLYPRTARKSGAVASDEEPRRLPRRQAGRNGENHPHSRIYRFFYDSLRCGWFVQGVYD